MNAKEALVTAAILVPGAVLNYGYPYVAQALAVPFGIEFVIVAYCLVVMTIPLRMAEVIGIGILAAVLNILSNPVHLATVLGGQSATAAGILAFSNLASEPVGILVCFFAFAYLAGRIRTGAPFAAAFLATMASGLVYLLTVLLLHPGILSAQPEYLGSFLFRVGEAAITNALVVQILFMAAGGRVKSFLEGRPG
nr:hypothetical protein [uncultured Methanoregula sp.]